MQGYIEICSQEDIQELLQKTAGFHDSITKEFRVVSNGYVDADKSMVGGGPFSAHLLIQTQWEPYAVEMIFINLVKLELLGQGDQYWATGKYIPKSTRSEIQFSFENKFNVTAERVFYAFRPEWVGRGPFLGSELPTPNAIPAQRADDLWRICTACWDAWECDTKTRFSRCPICGRMTDVGLEGET